MNFTYRNMMFYLLNNYLIDLFPFPLSSQHINMSILDNYKCLKSFPYIIQPSSNSLSKLQKYS